MNVCDIKNIESEAGIIASIVMKPELTFYSEQLKPNHFSDSQNAYIYYAVCELAKRGIEKVDAYNITNILNMKEATKKQTEVITIQALNDLIEIAKVIARESVEEYKLLVANVLDAAFRRDTYNKLVECERLCFNSSEADIEQKIYSALDDVMMEFSTTTEVPQYKDVVDSLWGEIEARQDSGMAGIPFKFETLNAYATIERGELFIFAAEAKQGKSMMLLNCAVDLLKRDVAVLYIDSELNSRMFTCRLISHLTGIEFSRLKAGRYTDDEKERIDKVIAWLKTKKFTHLYMPMFDAQSIYTAVKKVKHTQGLDVLIVDYFKGKGEGDAFDSYQELGRFVDMVKNQICGDMNIAGIGAAQATATGKVADSAKIGRNASTIALIQDKTPEEIEADGIECGNKKLRICLNRNGAQMSSDQYIDLQFNGNIISYEEAKQHIPVTPY
ncbi:MAG: AAA family ATPase [Alistipes sp.]|nr:AAA family ATPase [Clostridia bacterium]MBR2031217.1 AAA family ATPase [Alistipes sp.]MBR2859501.1 AAA family ATPase [Alistipes sp.]